MEAAKQMADSIRNANKNKPSPYDTTAKVKRVEGDTVWVEIPGGEDETPVQKTVNAFVGDNVQVRVSGGRAWITGNVSNPPTDDRVANRAVIIANRSEEKASDALEDASEAINSSNIARIAADSAVRSANEASIAADEAKGSAREAKESAELANYAANTALTELSIVEDVSGTLNWIRDHGTYVATTDTTVQEGTIYFSYNETAQDYEPIALPDPEANPSEENWYVLDVTDSQSEFIMSHLAVTGRGLWVLPSGLGINNNDPQYAPNYKVLLSNNGMYVYDGYGALVTTFGESVTFSSNRAQYIGGENAYIVFDPSNGSMNIGGSRINITGNVVIGGTQKTLSQYMAEMVTNVVTEYALGDDAVNAPSTGWDSATPTWTPGKYVWQRTGKTINGQTQYSYACIQGAQGQKGEDAVQLSISSTRGTVFKNNTVSTILNITVYVGDERITNILDLRNKFGDSANLQWYWLKVNDSDYGRIVSTDSKLSNNGFSLTLTPADVENQVTFRCELHNN